MRSDCTDGIFWSVCHRYAYVGHNYQFPSSPTYFRRPLSIDLATPRLASAHSRHPSCCTAFWPLRSGWLLRVPMPWPSASSRGPCSAAPLPCPPYQPDPCPSVPWSSSAWPLPSRAPWSMAPYPPNPHLAMQGWEETRNAKHDPKTMSSFEGMELPCVCVYIYMGNIR